MKKLFVFIPALVLVVFLLNSFVLKEEPVEKKAAEKAAEGIVLKSNDGGQTWQDTSEGLPEIEQPVMNVVESDGVLIATGAKGIMRSTDNGEHWKWVIKEGGVGIAVERIEGGFAAIAYNTMTKTRRIHISLDNGQSWKVISDGLGPSMFISSIKQMGKYLICGHPEGIFRSSDMGETWNLVRSSVDKVDNSVFKFVAWSCYLEQPKRVFKIYASGTVLYAVAGSSGC